jgi:uncharacterized protein YprB with RNaseH-like and TPR domain
MRDLTARLRDIVRRDHGGAAPAPLRELTYVPDTGAIGMEPSRAAEALGGAIVDAGHGSCIAIDRVWDADHSHGRRAVGGYAPAPDAPLGLFDARAAAADSWSERVVFFDLETTGLSGGAGTLPFLAGCGWFENGAFRVRQFFLAAPSGERAMLEALARLFDDATLLVTFNGRTFDVPLMETRWAFHREAAATDDLPHFDMLPSARRLWARREMGDAVERASCTLSALERAVLGFHRLGDVPGFEIPMRYFHFLRTGDAGAIEGVLEHNRYDLLSLACVMSHALWMAREGPDACREASELMGLGRLYERVGETDRALLAFERAAEAGDRDLRPHALARLAVMLGRQGRYDEAALRWQSVLNEERVRRGPMSPLARRAAEALAIHHEHRARNLATARTYAEQLQADAAGRAQRDAAHRLGRIDRKLEQKVRSRGALDL